MAYLQKKFSVYARAALYHFNQPVNRAVDLFNDALLKLIRAVDRDTFDLKHSIATYFYSILINLVIRAGQGKQEVDSFDEEVHSEDESPEYTYDIDRSLLHKILDEKLEQLKEKCREILELVWKEYTHEAISRELGLSVMYVNKKKTLCRQELMRLIMNDPYYESIMESFNYYYRDRS